MADVINLFTGAREVQVDEEDWDSGLPLTFEEIGLFVSEVQTLLEREGDHDLFVEQMREIKRIIDDWPDG